MTISMNRFLRSMGFPPEFEVSSIRETSYPRSAYEFVCVRLGIVQKSLYIPLYVHDIRLIHYRYVAVAVVHPDFLFAIGDRV
jgi:hypothetical protein